MSLSKMQGTAKIVVTIFVMLIIATLIISMIVGYSGSMLPSDTVSGSRTYTNIETFEDDTVGQDPNGNSSAGEYNPFYTYDETAWTGTPNNDDVNDTDSYDGSQSMWLAGNNSDADSQYYFLGEDGDELCGRTDITTITWAMNFEVDNSTNTGVDYTLYDCDSGIIVWLEVDQTNAILYTTGPTELMNITISNMTWYRVEVTIDYTPVGSPGVHSEFWSHDLAGFFTVSEDSNDTNIDCSKVWLMVASPARAGLDVNSFFDDLELDYTMVWTTDYGSGISGTLYAFYIIVSVIFIVIVISVLMMLFSKDLWKK